MANIIQNSIGKIQNYIQSRKEVSPVPAPKPVQYKDFSYRANNLKRAILKPLVQPAENLRFASQNPATAGRFLQQTIDKTPLPKFISKPIGQTVSNYGQTTFSGIGDVFAGTQKMGQDGLLNKGIGGLQTVRGIGKLAIPFVRGVGKVPINTLFSGANIVSNLPQIGKGDALRRSAKGILTGMSGENIARNVQDKYEILGMKTDWDTPLGRIAFDPYQVGGSMVGFVKNPVNDKFFKLTEKVIPSSGKIGEWLVRTATRGGIEDIALNLPDMNMDISPQEKVQWMVQTFGMGALQEIGGRAILKGLGKIDENSLKKPEVQKAIANSYDKIAKQIQVWGTPVRKWDNELGRSIKAPQIIHDLGIAKIWFDNRGMIDLDAEIGGKPEVSVDKKGKIKFKPQDVKIEEPDINIRPDVQKILDQGKYSRTGIKESLQDSYIRIKRLQNLKNVKVDEKSNIYVAEELMHGRVGTRLMNSFDEVKAIDDKIVQLEKIDKNINKKVQEYLIAQHAPERNKALGENAAGMTTKEANKILKDLENDPNAAQIKEVVQDFENLNKKVLDTLYEGQIITKELYDGLRSKYKHHVPLNRIMDETDDITQILTGRGRDVRGTGIKSAKGSEREVSDIAGNIVTNLQQAIIRSEKNKVNLAVLEFARQNPELGLFEIEKPKAIGTSFDGRPIIAKTNDPQILVLRENGKEVQLRIKNDNLAATIRGINIQKLPEFFNGVSAFTRFYSQLHTRFNPEFAIPNIVRDSQEMATYLSSQKDIGITGAGKALSKQPQSVKVMIDAVRGVDNADTRLYKQMQMDGGTTGGMALSTKQDVEMNIEKIRQLNRSNPRKAASEVLESFDTWNQVFEDATRFSVYKQALENGASRQRAASLAKNASLNFNRKGTATPIVNSLWMFSNASIQGTTKMLTALKNPKTLAAVTAAVGSSVYATNEWNDAVDPGWREKVTEWDQQSNLVIMLPSKSGAKYITIPVSWGLKPIKTTMDAMYQAYRGDDMDFQKASEDIAQAFIDGYNPTGGTDLISSVMPTILDIPVELIRNKGWYGGPIKPTYLEGEPEQKQYKKSTEKKLSGRVAIYIADKLAQYSADKIAISPDHILYAYNQYIGGVGRFGTKIFDTASSLTKGNAPDLNTVPFSSRFLKEKTEDDIKTQKYYDGMDKISQKYTKSWDTKLENAYSYLKSPKTLDEYGFQSRNINESLAFAQIRLANPQIVAREAEEARLRSKINGTPYNPMYDLPYDKQRVVLTLASLPPGQQKSALQKENIEWLKPYWNDVAKYSNEMKRLGIFKDNPNYETAPKASARAQALMDQGNWNDPEVRAYLQANNEYKNRVLAELGLPPLESTTSKWGSYTKRPKKVSFNMGKVKKARVVKSSPQKIFGTRKISTPKIKAVEAPRVRAVARIDTPRIRKVKFKA